MKKKLAVLLAFMMILSTMCSLNLVSAEPSADAPAYVITAGPTENSDGNEADGKQLFSKEDWNETTYAGLFPLTISLENTKSGAAGQFYIKYDSTKVELQAYDKKAKEWRAAAEGDKPFYTTYWQSETGASAATQGFDLSQNYVFTVWNSGEAIDADGLNAEDIPAELGCFVFKPVSGKTVGDFDENTFTIGYDVDPATVKVQTGTTSPLFIKTGDGEFGVSDDTYTRPAMNIVFGYPNSTPVAKYIVTFLNEDGSTYQTYEKKVGETLAVADFPVVPEKKGYTGEWDVKTNITAAATVRPVYTKIPDEPDKPDPNAPAYVITAGPTENSDGNEADGKQLFSKEDWNETTYAGLFPLTISLENTKSGAAGQFYIKYDSTKVELQAYDKKAKEWRAAAEGDKPFYTTYWQSETGASAATQGFDLSQNYVFTVWNSGEAIDADGLNAEDIPAELGCFVFKPVSGKTVGDFDENTFTIGYDVDPATVKVQTGTTSPLFIKTGDGEFGVSDDTYTRPAMNIVFGYPNSTPKPVEQFTVTFVADGVTVNTITKNVGEKVAVSEFPEVPSKAGFTGAWDVKEDITTTTVNAVYTPISTGDAKLNAIFTDGFKVADFDADTKEYKDIKASIGYDNYVIAGYADAGVKIEYSIDNGAFESANKENAFYFDLERGKVTSVKIKLTNAASEETIYSFEIVLPAAEVSYFETSGFEIEGFTPETKEYTVTPDSSEKYMRLWGKGPVDDDGIKFEYAIGEATDTPESKDYEALAVNCDARENEYFEGTPNFDVNWSEKGFVNLWTEDGLSGKAMFIKVISEGAPDSYYVIKFQ